MYYFSVYEGTQANIGGAHMSNNQLAVCRNFLQSYWTSDGLSLYSSQPACEKINTVKDLASFERPHVTSHHEYRALYHLVRRMPFTTRPVLKTQWSPNINMSARTVKNHLKSVGMKSMRVIERPMLSDLPQRLRLAWCLARRDLNIRTWRSIYWSNESRFLLHVSDGRMRVCRRNNMVYTSRNIQPTVPFVGGSVMIWGCISCWTWHTGKSNMSQNLNLIEHVWDMLDRRVQAVKPSGQNLRQLKAALHREWRQLRHQHIRQLIGGMRRIEAVIQARDGFARFGSLNYGCR